MADLLTQATLAGINAERAISRGVAALARTWPSGNKRPARTLPGWPEHLIGFMLQQTGRELTHVNAFFSVGIVKAGVQILQQDIGAIPIRVYRGRGKSEVEVERTGKRVDQGGNLADLLEYANPEQTGRQLRESLVGSLILNGNGYWTAENLTEDLKRPPVYLRDMPGHLVRPVPGHGRRVMGYEFQSGGEGAWEPVDAEVVIPFRRYNPLDRPIGVSDLEAVKSECEAEYFALLWMRELFRHGGVFPGIWGVDEKSEGTHYTDEELDDIAKRIAARHAGIEGGKVFLPMIMQGLKYIANGPAPSEIEVEQKIKLIDARITLAMGIPPWRMGIQEGQGLSKAAGADADVALYFLNKIAGELDGICDVLNERLCPRFGRDFHVRHGIRDHLLVQSLMLEHAEKQQKLTGNKPVKTQNEIRKANGDPESKEEGADSLKPTPIVQAGIVPPGEGNGPTPKDPEKKPVAKNRLKLVAQGEARENLRRREGFRLETHRARMETLLAERLAGQRATAIERLRASWERSDGTLALAMGQRVQLAIEIESLLEEPSEDDLTLAGKLLRDLLRARALDALRDLQEAAGVVLEVEINLEAAAWADFIAQQVDRAIRVPDDTTRRALRQSLGEGLEAREGLADLIARVDRVFDGRRNNVATIARTETQPAYNFAAIQVWRESGVVDRHEWLTSRSGLGGRHSEDPEGRYAASDGGRGLDGQVRTIGEAFDVGGVAMLYPGDPAAPVGETANCVCTVLPVINQEQLRWRQVGEKFRAAPHVNGHGKLRNRVAEFMYGMGK